MEEKVGKITHLDRFGLGRILLEGNDGIVKSFTFDKMEGYRGESLGELKKLGFKAGAIIKFTTNNDGRIERVRTLIFNK